MNAKDWIGNQKSTFVMLGASNHSEKEREKEDYYATDPHALEIFLEKFEVKVIKNNKLYGVAINEDFVTLKQISDESPEECITVIAESPLSGTIYRYNNYGDKKWQLIGTMLGYA